MVNKQIRAVALISGGLDSMLAAKVVMEQGVEVHGLNFFTGFCVEGHTHAIRKQHKEKPKRNNALWSAEQLGIKLHIDDVSEPYKDVVINPKHGYGANLNPCLDCKGFMVGRARLWMEENDFDFMITGEVIGQRPMSQRRDTMPVIQKEGGIGDRLLRPLCAQLLPETLPEREGWVNREQMHGFSGRSRKPQIALAESFGFSEWSQPAGGCCFLTDASYSSKLQDLWNARGTKEYEIDDIVLLKIGRHIRPRPEFKLIVSREEGENNFLRGYRRSFGHFEVTSHPGPLTLVDLADGDLTGDNLQLAARIVARFSQGRDAAEVTLDYVPLVGETQQVTVSPMDTDEVLKSWYV